MADYSVYEGVVAYAKQLLIAFAQNSKVAFFNDPNNQILSVKGKETAIREIETAGAGDYTGKFGEGIDTASSDQKKYYAPYDRAYSAVIDSLKEAQSYVDGSTPTLVGVATSYLKKRLAPEIDTAIIARYASQVASGNVHQNNASGYGITAANVLETLANIEKDVANAGYDGDVVTFVSATVNAAIEQALLAKNILANEVVINREMTKGEIAPGFDPLKIELRARKINNLLIVPVPDDRMIGKVYMLDGFSAGQEDGGVLPAKNLSTYYDVNILAIPLEAAYANIRHIVNQLFVPLGFDTDDYQENINKVNEKLLGVIELQNNGIYQAGDSFRFNSRCVYGGDIFEIYRDACVLVKGASQVQTVAPVRGEFVGAASALSGADGATSDLKFAFEELNCSGTVYFTSSVTAKATVDASETLTVPTEGADLRPYCAPTVTFDAAGDSVITAWADSSHTIKLAEVTVTSTG